MTNKEIKIAFQEFESIDQLDSADNELAQAAIKATGRSYAPYSGFSVGAALRLDDGSIVSGANQENAAFPSGLCAERTAIFYAGAEYPDKAIKALAIAARQNGTLCEAPVTPCGACRQVMAESQKRSGKPIEVILIGGSKIWKFGKVDDLLPFIFDNI